jgi:inner membrane protein
MAADLDVLIRSNTDPLLFLEYHRQFTHSLFFIPLGGVLSALFLHWIFGRRWHLSFIKSCIFCISGYATHALLDACTTYGTQLLWPFNDHRFAWNNMSIIDPVYTLPLIVLVITAAIKKRPLLAKIALVWVFAYPCFGVIQRERAEAAGWQLAFDRGHQPLRLEAKPSFANLLLWKIIYETEQYYYVDAVRVVLSTRLYPGDSVEKLDIEKHLTWLDRNSQQAKDIVRFRIFSNDYIAVDKNNNNRIVDIRYSMVPNEIDALWSIELSPNAAINDHAAYKVTRESTPRHMEKLRMMVLGN